MLLELKDGIAETAQFLDLLVDLAPQLSHLQLLKQKTPLDFLLLLYALPELTHLICQFQINTRLSSSAPISTDIPINYTTKLTCLWLHDSHLSVQEKELLLMRSPNLQCYTDSQISGILRTVNLDSLFQWCPKINVYSAEYTNQTFQHNDYFPYIDSDAPGLRYFYAKTGDSVDQVVRQLVKNKDTLEYFAFCNYQSPFDWLHTHEFALLSSLRTLLYRSYNLDAHSFVVMLNHCPILETFDIRATLILDTHTIRSLGVLHALCHLECYSVRLNQDLSLLTLLEHFPALEKLVLKQSKLPLTLPLGFKPTKHLKQLALSKILWIPDASNEDQGIAVLRFLKFLTSGTKLEDLHLSFIKLIPGPLLWEIVSIPTLRHIDVHTDRALNNENMEEFIKALQHTAVKILKLSMVFRVSLANFNALADLQHLVTIRLTGPGTHLSTIRPLALSDLDNCPRVSKEGVLQLLQKSPKLATLELSMEFAMENEQQQVELDPTDLLLKQVASNVLEKTSRHWNVLSADIKAHTGDLGQRTDHTITRVDE